MSPFNIFMRVDLPEPFLPGNPIRSPSSARKYIINLLTFGQTSVNFLMKIRPFHKIKCKR